MYGVTYILPIGSFLHVFGLMMTSLSNNYYQIILSQGFCSPLGASMIFFSGIFATGGWFDKKRALAFGIVASGSSLGGVIFPIMLQRLIPEIGFPWAMRTAAFMILGLLLIANATIKTRFPPAPKPLQLKLYVTPFREAPFALTMLSGFFSFFGFLIPFNFVQESALYYGMSQGLAQYMIPILNAASIFGRVLAGFMGDKLGRFNIMSIVLGVSGLVCLAIWLPARSNAPIIVFAIIYGVSRPSPVALIHTLCFKADAVLVRLRSYRLHGAIMYRANLQHPRARVSQRHLFVRIFTQSFTSAHANSRFIARLFRSARSLAPRLADS